MLSIFDRMSVQDAKDDAKAVAREIVDLGAQVDQGRFNLLDDDDPFERVNYSRLCPLLRRAADSDLRFPEMPRDVTDEHRAAAAEILGDDLPAYDELLETGLKVMAESARQYWQVMTKTTLNAQDDPGLYTGFHAAITHLELEAGSSQLHEFLGVDAAAYKRVDQAYALAYIYDVVEFDNNPLFDAMSRIYLAERQKNSDVPVDLAQAFAKSKEQSRLNTSEDILSTMRDSGLSEEQVQTYLMRRIAANIESATSAPAAGPKRTLN